MAGQTLVARRYTNLVEGLAIVSLLFGEDKREGELNPIQRHNGRTDERPREGRSTIFTQSILCVTTQRETYGSIQGKWLDLSGIRKILRHRFGHEGTRDHGSRKNGERAMSDCNHSTTEF